MRLHLLALSLLLLGLVGCGGNKLGAVPAKGSVTLDSQPVTNANITFIRESGGGPAAYAVTDATGNFELKTASLSGAVPGKYKVLIQKDNSADLAIPDGVNRHEFMEQSGFRPRSLLPVHYSQISATPLHYEVFKDPAMNLFDIKLNAERTR